jgi:hypothetical protein
VLFEADIHNDAAARSIQLKFACLPGVTHFIFNPQIIVQKTFFPFWKIMSVQRSLCLAVSKTFPGDTLYGCIAFLDVA